MQEALTIIGGYTYLLEATRLFTVTALDRGEKPAVASAISKYHTTELSRTILNHSMDVHGGKGICMGPNNYSAQSYIEAPISITVEGANILTRSMIIFGQGAIRCHPYVLKEMSAAKDNHLIEFDRALFSHLGFIVSNKVRAFFLGLTNGYLVQAPKGQLKRYYQQFSRFSAAFALVSDVAMISEGAALKRKENLSARLGDLLSWLYMGSAAIKYTELQDEEQAQPCIQWVCETILYRLQSQLNEFLLNMSNRWLAWSLRRIVFPLGKRYTPPSDALAGEVAQLFLSPSHVRQCLSQHVYLDNTVHNPVGEIESVLQQVIAVAPLENKIHQAVRDKKIAGESFEQKVAAAVGVRVLTDEEGQQCLDAYSARMQIINVDDFGPGDLPPNEKKRS